jgi:hypothetical protein
LLVIIAAVLEPFALLVLAAVVVIVAVAVGVLLLLTFSTTLESQGDALGEVIYRFEFPEAPGALNRFLDTLNRFNQG